MRLLTVFALAFALYITWPTLTELKSVDDLKTEINSLKSNPEINAALDAVTNGISQLKVQLDSAKNQQQNSAPPVEKPELQTPAQQSFSIHNIEIGDLKEEVEKQLGAPKRTSLNEYGTAWHSYHVDYQNFLMVSYNEESKVNGLYTNQDLISSNKGIKFGSPKLTVHEAFGESLTKIVKGSVQYQLQAERDYDVYQQDGSYITIFYDQHQNNSVTAIQIISEDLEQSKQGFYSNASDQVKQGFEFQLFDLTNASRVNNGLSILSWDDQVTVTARKHSQDMAANNYFNHTNLQGESPFDRMAEDDIVFSVAGENLAFGQFSSIFAHEGLMNSLGHRENILKPDFELLGVGVAFGTKQQPYFTENFYSKRM